MELEALASIGRLSDRIYAILKGKILQGSLPPDEHLPLEQIARNLGVSTTPVRDALNLLAADGLVEWIPRRGAFVTKLSLQTVEEVFQIREFLECAAIELPPAREPQVVAEMQRLVEQMVAALARPADDDVAGYGALELRFHTMPVASLGNARLMAFYASLASLMTISFVLYHFPEPRRSQAIEEHRPIVAALRRGDGHGAREALCHHLRNSREALAERVSQATTP